MTRLRSQCPCIIFDSSRDALVAGLKAAPWLVKPNRRELEIWAGRKLPELKDVIEAAHALREGYRSRGDFSGCRRGVVG
jgi:1-phosphofructokinase